MKAKEVMEALRISRSTLYNLRKQKALDHHVLPNGHYDLKLNKVFNADLNGALNILKAGAKLHEWALPLKISLFKLATPIRMNLDAFYYR